MEIEIFISLIALAIAGGITPGPNNALLANSGATFGFKRTIPHYLGVSVGYAFMLACVGLGLGALFEASPLLQTVMTWLSVGLLIWIAYKIGTSGSLGSAKAKIRPFTFLEATAFQWVNPKAWAFAISVTAQFVTAQNPLTTSFIVAGTFLCTGLMATSVWVGMGHALQHWLKVGHRLIWFNRAMAFTIILSVALLFVGP